MLAYVYAISVDGVVRYIGKGRGRRVRDHINFVRRLIRRRAEGERVKSTFFYNKLADAFVRGSCIEAFILVSDMTDDAAYAWEKAEIAAHRGQLWNQNEGGVGPTSADALKRWADQGCRDRHRTSVKALWSDPEFRAKRDAIAADPEFRAKLATGIAAAWTPDMKAAKAEEVRRRYRDPEERKKTGAAIAAALANPATKARQGEALKRRFADPEYRRKWLLQQAARAADPDHRKRVAETMRARWADPEERARMLASRAETAKAKAALVMKAPQADGP